jgi:pimeloyl-ACP methyl ester carboxylesterase
VDTTGTNDTNTIKIDDKIRTTVFVHGTNEAVDVFTELTQRFMLNGYTEARLVAFDFENYYSGSEIDIQKMATQLGSRIEAAITASGESRIDIIAHGSGANVVQYWLVNLDGAAKAAHVIFVGGSYDPSLTAGGDITPGPCKYLTLRSDGKDAAQQGNTQYGSLAGATNEQLAGLDNLQLVSDKSAFEKMYAFLTGASPSEKNMPNSRIGMTYEIKGRVINFIDNTPIGGATVIPIKIRTLTGGDIQRQTGLSPITADANGYFTFSDVVGPEQHLEFMVRVNSQSHYDMHIYRQSWRSNSFTERLRMIPRSGGESELLNNFSAAVKTGTHAVMMVMTQNRTMQFGRDNVTLRRYNPAFDPIGEASVLTQSNAPVPGGTAQNGNTWFLTLQDYDMNGQDGTGPIFAAGLNFWGINSYDCFLDASTTNFQTQVDVNGVVLGTFNYRSSGASGSNNSGFDLIQFEY